MAPSRTFVASAGVFEIKPAERESRRWTSIPTFSQRLVNGHDPYVWSALLRRYKTTSPPANMVTKLAAPIEKNRARNREVTSKVSASLAPMATPQGATRKGEYAITCHADVSRLDSSNSCVTRSTIGRRVRAAASYRSG